VPVIVKFPTRADPGDAGRIELAYAAMAVAAGIDMPPVWLLGEDEGPGYFATRRFDRLPRVHTHTLRPVSNAGRPTGWSWSTFAPK